MYSDVPTNSFSSGAAERLVLVLVELESPDAGVGKNRRLLLGIAHL
jgi:hypothetical protein